MNRKSIIIVSCCFTFATATVLILYAATNKIVHEPNSFLRLYEKEAVEMTGEMDVEFNSWYIAGVTEDQIYLGNVTAPFDLLIVDRALRDSQRIKLTIESLTNPVVYKSTTVKIDPPYFYLADGLKPALYRGKLGEWKAYPYSYNKGAYFTQIVPVSKSSFVIRTNEGNTLDNILGKVQKDEPSLTLKAGLLQKQIDGNFCTDGILLYNEKINKLIYTYFYRNEYIVCDTNLNLSYRGHTIDTFSRAQIKVGHIGSSNRNKLLESKFVNLRGSTSGKYLFIKSNLLAKNDVRKKFEHESVIDVYDLVTSTYQFSFSLPNYIGESQAREFVVFENKTLIALYDHFIVKYDLNPRHFTPIAFDKGFTDQ